MRSSALAAVIAATFALTPSAAIASAPVEDAMDMIGAIPSQAAGPEAPAMADLYDEHPVELVPASTLTASRTSGYARRGAGAAGLAASWGSDRSSSKPFKRGKAAKRLRRSNLVRYAAAKRYVVTPNVQWATVRNKAGSYVVGAAAGGDAFDATDFRSSAWRGGFSTRAGCGSMLIENLWFGSADSSAPCATNTDFEASAFLSIANCMSCNTYTTVTSWATNATSATACMNLSRPIREITPSTPATCRDPRTIYRGDQIGWRYATKDYKWIAIVDRRFGEGEGPWMFVPNGLLNLQCHSAGCWAP